MNRLTKTITISAFALIPAMLASSAFAAAPEPAQAGTFVPPVPTGPFASVSKLPFGAPDFAAIKDSDYRPAIEQGIAIKRAEIEAIANNPEPATFANTIEAMERAGRMLDRATAAFSLVTGANTNDTLDAADSATSPQLAALGDAIVLNSALFARVKALHDKEGSLGLAPDQKMLLDITYDSFVHEGAQLGEVQKTRLKAINERLSSLFTQFGQQLTAATRDGALVVHDKAALAGLSDAEIAAAAKAAEERKLPAGSYVLPLQNTTQQPALGSLTNRATREALYKASWTRAEQGGKNDTRALIAEMAQLRAEKAQLLGFKDFASYALSDQMAKTPQAADGFMARLVPAIARQQHLEAAELSALIAKEGGHFAVQPWDWQLYSGKARKAQLNFDEGSAKPYLEITRVLEDGVFYAANRLYGLTFKKRTDIPVYQSDVTTYTVYDKDGSELALFYFDPWKRDNKQGGAWMSNLVQQSSLMGTKPVVYNIENFTKPAAGQPALISFDDAVTMFHEFGHGLHGMLSNQRYPSISGANTARDFVEFPSQFNENWATDPKVLAHYARHYQTGAVMPAAMVAKLKQLRQVDQGYEMGEVVAAAMLDMAWHKLPASAPKQDVDAFEAKALAATGLDVTDVPTRYRTSYFRHIWGNGYAAGYYAYLWTQMLDHDAFAWFTAHGGLTRANGERFRKLILSRGHSADYGVMFRSFTGHNPDVRPMLKARGLLNTAPTKKGHK